MRKKKAKLMGNRITERTLQVSGPAAQVQEFKERLSGVDGIDVVHDDDDVVTFLFCNGASPLLTLLPPVGTEYPLGLQEG